MTKKIKTWIILSITLMSAGAIMFVVAMFGLKWNFRSLSTIKYQTNTYEITEEFSSITIEGSTADVVFVPSLDDKITVTCYENEKIKNEVYVFEGTLKIIEDTRKWYNHVGFNFETSKITVSIPAGNYGALVINCTTGDIQIGSEFSFESIDISATTSEVGLGASINGLAKIKLSTGKIFIRNVNAGEINLETTTGDIFLLDVTCIENVNVTVDTGDVEIKNLSCKNMFSKGDTGEIEMFNVFVQEKIEIERDTGDVEIEKSDAGEISVKTSTGDVEMNFLTEKIVFANSRTGKVSHPKATEGGPCEIRTSTGDIKVTFG